MDDINTKQNYGEFSSFEEEKTQVFAEAEKAGVQAGGRSYDKLAKYLFLALGFLLPLWFLPFTAEPLGLNKAYLAYGLLIAAGFLWVGERLRLGIMSFPKSAIFLAFLGLIAVFGASTVFSLSPSLSFFGTGSESTTFIAIFIFSIAAFLASVFFRKDEDIAKWYTAIFASSAILFVIQIFQSAFGITILPFSFFQSRLSNLIGSWNELGIFFGFVALSGVLLQGVIKGGIAKKIVLFSSVASLIGAAFVNFTLVWWVLAPLFVIFFTYRFITAGRGQIFSFATLAIIISVFLIFGASLMGEINNALGINVIDVRPTVGATWGVVKNALGENPILGSGPNTFLYDWLRWKPLGVNNTVFWASRFQSGFGTLISAMATVGILGGFAFLALLALVFWKGVRTILSVISENSSQPYLVASFFGALYLWIFAIVYSPGFLLIFLAFLMTGIFIGALTGGGYLKEFRVSLFEKKGPAFVWTLLMIFLIVVGSASIYFLSQKYVAAYSFGGGLRAFNVLGNADSAERAFLRAARFDTQDRYYRSLAEVNLAKLNQLLSRQDLTQEEMRAQFQQILNNAVQNTRLAADANPNEPLNWATRGKIFEALIPFGIEGAAGAARDSYQKAAELSPHDPEILLALARVEIQGGGLDKAREALSKSIGVKNDYAPAHFLLAQVEAQSGNIDEAILSAERAAIIVPNDIGALFQLGLLYYQKGNLDQGRLALERAVALNANYSNARYFLGIIYDRQGNKTEAISQFETIQELNPGNEEVRMILENLRAGKGALDGISPPAPGPERRESLPVEEEGISDSLNQ